MREKLGTYISIKQIEQEFCEATISNHIQCMWCNSVHSITWEQTQKCAMDITNAAWSAALNAKEHNNPELLFVNKYVYHILIHRLQGNDNRNIYDIYPIIAYNIYAKNIAPLQQKLCTLIKTYQLQFDTPEDALNWLRYDITSFRTFPGWISKKMILGRDRKESRFLSNAITHCGYFLDKQVGKSKHYLREIWVTFDNTENVVIQIRGQLLIKSYGNTVKITEFKITPEEYQIIHHNRQKATADMISKILNNRDKWIWNIDDK
jgi:hypothetical protein